MSSIAEPLVQHGGRQDPDVAVLAVLEAVPVVPQIITQQIVEAVGQVSVLLEFHARLAVHDLFLGLGAVVVAQLVDQVLGKPAAAQVDAYFPAVVSVEDLIHEVAARNLRRLFLQKFQFGPQHAAAQRVEDLRIVVDPLLVGRRALQARRVARNVYAADVLVAV